MKRREFLKAGALAAAAGAVACTNKKAGNITGGTHDGEGGAMEYRTNPGTGDSVSLLGYGCMRWQTVEDENGGENIDQESVNELVDIALENGVNYFDSAPVYHRGQSERATALALLRHPRDSYFIATKCSNFRSTEKEDGIAMYRKSLENFETDHIDYYLLHSLHDGKQMEERFIANGLLDFFADERKAGRIRNLGFSFHGDEKGFDELIALHGKYHWDFVQIQMNYSDWEHPGKRNGKAEHLYRVLSENDIPVIIMEPLLGGRLADIPDALAAKLKQEDPAGTVASWAFRFCGSFPKVLTVLSGMTYREHLQDNLKTFRHFSPLDGKDMELLKGIAETLSDYPVSGCTGCEYCMPCPYGVNIPGIFAHYDKCVNEGLVGSIPAELTRDGGTDTDDSAEFRRARRRYLSSYEKAVPSISQADHCIHCGACREKCPQRIDIPTALGRIDRLLENLKLSR